MIRAVIAMNTREAPAPQVLRLPAAGEAAGTGTLCLWSSLRSTGERQQLRPSGCLVRPVFVETLDRCFKNVCELDIVFHFNKMHTILDEMIHGGQVLETSSEEVMRAVEEIASWRSRQMQAVSFTRPCQEGSAASFMGA